MKILFAPLLTLAALPFGASAQSTIALDGQFAWGANTGWIALRPERPNAGDGVRVGDTFLSGYAWSPNTGWIDFGDGTPANSLRYSNASDNDCGVNQDGAGNLSGLAWSPNTGWINFGWATTANADRPRFEITSGQFLGYAWSANVGWINLGTGILRTESVAFVDADHDGISDTWELAHAPTTKVLTATGDADNDGIPDLQEFLLDTDPLVPNLPFGITRIAKLPGVDSVVMQWPSQPTRIYGIEAKLDLSSTDWLFLDNVPGTAGTRTLQAIESGAHPEAFFRVTAKLPLMP